MDKIKALRGVLLCEAFLADIINILKGKGIDNLFLPELAVFHQIDDALTRKLPKGIDKECVRQVTKAVGKVSHRRQTPAEYLATLLNIIPFVNLYLPEDLQMLMTAVRNNILEKSGQAIPTVMLSEVENFADQYLKAVYKDYQPLEI